MLLQYDSRVDCLSPEYTSYLPFAWVMAILWPIGCPLSLLLLIKSYNVPELAVRKLRAASIRAFLVYSMAKASDVGIDPAEGAPVGDSSPSQETDPTEGAPVEDSSPSQETGPTKVAPVEDSSPSQDTGGSGGRRSTGRSRRASRSAPERPFAGMRSYASFEDMAAPLLHLLCNVHGIDVSSPIKMLIVALVRRMDELLSSGELVVPLVVWDDESPDPAEQLAVRRLEGLIGAYETPQYWCARCASSLGLV